MTDAIWSFWTEKIGPRNAYNEYSAFSYSVSDALLGMDFCIMHAAALRRGDKAYLITAPSGVGKSTQVRTLTELYPDEFTVISGDRPVLEAKDDGTVFVHPSPWNGKEGWAGAGPAPLSGIIMLERGEENRVVQIAAKQAAVNIFTAIFQTAENEGNVLAAAAFAEKLLNCASVWRFTNAGVPDSTRLLYETLFGEDNVHEL